MLRVLGMAALLAVAAGCGKGGGAAKATDSGAWPPSARLDPTRTQAKMPPATGPLVPIIKLPPATPTGLSTEEQLVLDLVNQTRAAEKMAPLKADPVLMKVAREQAVRSAKTRQPGSASAEEVKAGGYDFIAFGSGGGGAQGGDPGQEVGQWIKSTLRQSATEPGYEDVGVGFARAEGAENRYYYSAVFGKRKK